MPKFIQVNIKITRNEPPEIEVRDHPVQNQRYHGRPVQPADRANAQPHVPVSRLRYEIDADRTGAAADD